MVNFVCALFLFLTTHAFLSRGVIIQRIPCLFTIFPLIYLLAKSSICFKCNGIAKIFLFEQPSCPFIRHNLLGRPIWQILLLQRSKTSSIFAMHYCQVQSDLKIALLLT